MTAGEPCWILRGLSSTGWQSPADQYQARVDSFRGPGRSDDGAVDVLAEHLRADDRLLDVGAGAGRFSIPLARRVGEVLALEPSPSMSAALLADARAAGVSNVARVPTTWEDAPADLSADIGCPTRACRSCWMCCGSLERYPDVTMLDVPPWPPGNAERARRALPRRPHVVPGSPADDRLQSAMPTLLVDWGDGQLGPADRRPRHLAIVRWSAGPGRP